MAENTKPQPVEKKQKKVRPPKESDKKSNDELFGQVYTKKVTAPRLLRRKGDMTRFVKFPLYVRVQRQRRVLEKRLKIPPTLHQLRRQANKSLAHSIATFLAKYKPPTKRERLSRVRELAKLKKEGKKVEAKTPKEMKPRLIHGINEVLKSIEQKRAKLVVLPHTLANPEMICFIPSLCNKADIPYAIIKGQDRLGGLCHLKKTSCVCLNEINKEDKEQFDQIVESVKGTFNKKYTTDLGRKWGGGKLSKRSLDMRDKGLIRD